MTSCSRAVISDRPRGPIWRESDMIVSPHRIVAAEVRPRQRLVDDDDAAGLGGVVRREVAPADDRRAERVEVPFRDA